MEKYTDEYWLNRGTEDIKKEISRRGQQGAVGNLVVSILFVGVLSGILWYFNDGDLSAILTPLNFGVASALVLTFTLSGYYSGIKKGENDQKDRVFPVIMVKKLEEQNRLLREMVGKQKKYEKIMKGSENEDE